MEDVVKLFTKKFCSSLLVFLFVSSSVVISQNHPYLSAPVNGSTWEMMTPTLYWWYVPTPYSAGPFNFKVEVSQSSTDFTSAHLLINQSVTSGAVGSYTISSLVGLIPGVTYYWRIGVNSNYSDVWSFSLYNIGGITNYLIIATADSNGTITPSGSITVAKNSSKTFNIAPNNGYIISGLRVDNISVSPVNSFSFSNITSDHTINAAFTRAVTVPAYDTTFVNYNTGNDANGNGTRALPYKKIQRGLDRANAGGLVYVFNGNYAEDVVLTKPITVLGQTNPSTRSFIVRANNVKIKNFDVSQSSPGPGIQKVGLETYDYLKNLTLENISVYNNAEMGLLLENMDSITVKNCQFYGNAMGGIALINTNHIFMEDIGLEDNLRGFAAYTSTDINLTRLSSNDNGKAYLANLPDKNGITFSICNNLSLNAVTANENAEQGIKFEDCGGITLNNVSANKNTTDGLAFIVCNHIVYNTGTASSNGLTVDDNGIEFVACSNLEVTNVAANNNFNKGILFDYNYKGVYEWDPSTNLPTPLTTNFYGTSSQIVFTDVTADHNGNDGIYGIHLGYFTGKNLVLTNNGRGGLYLDAALHITLSDGKYDSNRSGLILAPTVNVHPIAPELSSDEITTFSFTGNVSLSNNTEYGILLTPALTTKITNPLFYGNFKIENNVLCGVRIYGKVTDPFYGGIFLKSTNNSSGFVITDNTTDQTEGIKISNSYFNGYTATNLPNTAAITLFAPIYAPASTAVNNVDARNNIFVGAANLTAVKTIIIDKDDNPSLGLVNVTGWTNGQPAINIGSASAYTGSLVTIPVVVNISGQPLSFTQLTGKIYFNELHLRYKYATYETGTIVHDADWAIIFDHSTASQLQFMTFGFNAVHATGILFYLTFEVVDNQVATEAVTGIASEWSINGGTTPFAINNGSVNYTSDAGTSLMKGDATMDFSVNIDDYWRILYHVNGNLLTGQALINADVNKDGRVDELDAADILGYINSGTWSNTALAGVGNLSMSAALIDRQGILSFPISLTNVNDIRSLQIEFTYDESKVDFRNYNQLIESSDIAVTAKNISTGVAKFIYTSAGKTKGNFIPAEVMFNVKSNSTANVINSTYSINGGAFQKGPVYGQLNVTGVEEAKNTIPDKFAVEQNYPNPFNPTTTIRYSLPTDGFVTVRIFDILGRNINTLLNRELKAGNYSAQWNGDNYSGAKVSSGTYFYQVKTGSNVITKKMVLIK